MIKNKKCFAKLLQNHLVRCFSGKLPRIWQGVWESKGSEIFVELKKTNKKTIQIDFFFLLSNIWLEKGEDCCRTQCAFNRTESECFPGAAANITLEIMANCQTEMPRKAKTRWRLKGNGCRWWTPRRPAEDKTPLLVGQCEQDVTWGIFGSGFSLLHLCCG